MVFGSMYTVYLTGLKPAHSPDEMISTIHMVRGGGNKHIAESMYAQVKGGKPAAILSGASASALEPYRLALDAACGITDIFPEGEEPAEALRIFLCGVPDPFKQITVIKAIRGNLHLQTDGQMIPLKEAAQRMLEVSKHHKEWLLLVSFDKEAIFSIQKDVEAAGGVVRIEGLAPPPPPSVLRMQAARKALHLLYEVMPHDIVYQMGLELTLLADAEGMEDHTRP